MRALLCKSFGPPESLVLEETGDPKMGSGSVLVTIKVAGLNFPDSLIVEGKYQFKPPFPFSPGGEVAGVVAAVGEKVKHFKPGDRVMGLTGWGGFAEKIAVAEQNLVPVPAELSDEAAAGFMMIYGTSMYALQQRGRLEAGQTLLVLGAGGGVGKAAVEIGKAMGARVIAAASSDEKLALAKACGADDLINYSRDNLKDAVKTLTKGQGVDVVYDPVGGELAEQALRSMGWDGRYLVVGFASGTIPHFPANLTLLKSCQIVGVFWGAFAQRFPAENLANFITLLQWVKEGKIDPRVSKVYTFEEAATAIADIGARRLSGKAVVRISE
jgi:NADPH2:quinone reductase